MERRFVGKVALAPGATAGIGQATLRRTRAIRLPSRPWSLKSPGRGNRLVVPGRDLDGKPSNRRHRVGICESEAMADRATATSTELSLATMCPHRRHQAVRGL
jgi:hypothetical protein